MSSTDWVDLAARALALLTDAEGVGAALGLAYVVLAVRESRYCWIFAAASTAIYLVVFARAHLLMLTGLQGFFLLSAAYGWLFWREGTAARPVTVGSLRSNGLALAVMVLLSAVTVRQLSHELDSADPWLDSLTTWASVYATVLQARKYRENWLWWIVIDVAIAAVCLRHGLWRSAGLYAVFVGLAALGWRQWRTQPASTDAA